MVRKFELDLILNHNLSINSAWLRYQRICIRYDKNTD
jgi:hypothetical protein